MIKCEEEAWKILRKMNVKDAKAALRLGDALNAFLEGIADADFFSVMSAPNGSHRG